MKEQRYFDHDIDTLNDSKIGSLLMDMGMEGYGLFWVCVEQMHKDKCGIRAGEERALRFIAHKAFSTAERVSEFLDKAVECGLFVRLDDGTVTSQRAMQSVTEYNARKAASSAGGSRSRRS